VHLLIKNILFFLISLLLILNEKEYNYKKNHFIMLIKTEIITLKSTPFKDNSKILQVLTKNLGIISIIAKGFKKNLNAITLCSPFTFFEAILKKRNSDIYSIEDVSIIDENFYLRKDFKYLNTASFIIKAVLNSHFPQKKAYNIYILLKIYLKKIFINPDAVYLSFLLKLMYTEGFLNLKTDCCICKKPAQLLHNGESFCSNHGSKYSFKFSNDDFKKLFILCYAKSFSLLKNIDISQELKEKTTLLFNDFI
jgi:DNA repair protein RecO (recombination protein O)